MLQSPLPFKYQTTETSGATALAGLPLFIDLLAAMGFGGWVDRHMPARTKAAGAWSDPFCVLSLLLLNLAGGDCVADLDNLRGDEGFAKLLRAVACTGKTRRERREKQRLFKKSGQVLPSATSVFRFLKSFHGKAQQPDRQPGTAVIVPEHERLGPGNDLLNHFSGPFACSVGRQLADQRSDSRLRPDERVIDLLFSSPLRGLWQVNTELLHWFARRQPQACVTLDGDATLVPTAKAEALPCYKGYKAYQPLNFFVAEWNAMVYSQFRDGNVVCGYEQLPALERALELLPPGVTKVKLRMDTQGYEWKLLRYLAEGKNKRFGAIDFVVGADMTAELRKEIAKVREDQWRELPREKGQVAQQWAEVPFVPNASATKKDGPSYRFIATREVLRQPTLAGVQPELPFQTMDFAGHGQCKIHAVVTATQLGGAELVEWYRGRCGKSEQAHSVMKSDLAGGQLPSGDFGANAAWWTIMQLALNVNEVFKRVALDKPWWNCRLKALRFGLICVAARVVEHARQLVVRLSADHSASAVLAEARRRILALFPGAEPAATG